MSYGLKFELFYEDLAQRKLKLEILQKDYSGTVYPFIGTGNPVTIEWKGKDDVHTPIIGSRCIINLFVTDDTQYDNFFESDEREYKVKI